MSKNQLLKVAFTFLVRTKGCSLLLLTREVCLVKKSLKSLTFSLKSDSHLPEKVVLFTPDESPLKMMKNTFYSILQALFVLNMFKLLS